ncbi:MAG: hypothetical protein V3S29_00475 [bacterium]
MGESENGGQPPGDAQTEGEPGQDPAPAPPAEPLVLELANTEDGCWKVLEGGQKVEITAAEWRKELARLFAKSGAAG